MKMHVTVSVYDLRHSSSVATETVEIEVPNQVRYVQLQLLAQKMAKAAQDMASEIQE